MGGNGPQEDPVFLAFIHCLPGNLGNCNFILNGAIARYEVGCSSLDTRLFLVPGPGITVAI